MLSMGFKCTVTFVLGQTSITTLSVFPAWNFQSVRDHRSSECDTQLPPGVVHLPWFTC